MTARGTPGPAAVVMAASALVAVLLLPAEAAAQAQGSSPKSLAQAKLKPGVELLARAIDIVRRRYVVEPEDARLVDDAIRGMLSRLDPDAHYFTPEDLREMQSGRSQAGTLGLHLRKEPLAKSSIVGLRVITADDGSPAAEVGLRPLDLITHIDGQPVTPRLSVERAGRQLSGPPQSPVGLTVLRRGQGEPVRVTLLRAAARRASRVVMLDSGVLFARPPTLGDDLARPFIADMMRARQAAGAAFRGVVLDLRDSAGGPIGEAVAIADAFLEGGTVATARPRSPGRATALQAAPGDLAAGHPVAVVINGGTTGAGEVIAGALKDRGRATIIGVRSFGRASQQTLVPVGERGSGGAVLLTTLRYLTPSDRPIDGKGIEPDVVIAAPDGSSCRDGDAASEDVEWRCAPRLPAGDPQLARAVQAILGERKATRGDTTTP
jgi:carboxyl-terminal processing protease